MQTSQTNETLVNIAAMASEVAAADSRAAEVPNQTMMVLAATTDISEAVSSSSLSTTADDLGGQLSILETDRFGLLRSIPFSSTGNLDPFQAALTTYFSNLQLMGRHDNAAAKPSVLPQTPQRESDLVLTGKQGKRLAELPGEALDDFFRKSLKFLLAPSQEAQPEKRDQTKPNVPGNEGNVDPGTQPEGGKDPGTAPREGTETDMKEGSLTWAGILLAAASGFRSLRNRRKQQRDTA